MPRGWKKANAHTEVASSDQALAGAANGHGEARTEGNVASGENAEVKGLEDRHLGLVPACRARCEGEERHRGASATQGLYAGERDRAHAPRFGRRAGGMHAGRNA